MINLKFSVCNTGHYYQQELDYKICLPCANGTFKSEIGDLECSECPAGSSTLTVGADQCGKGIKL